MISPRVLLIVGASLGALYSAGLFYEMNLGAGSCCGLTWPTPDPIAAERLAVVEDPKGINAAAEREAALKVLGARPAEPVAWLRLAYADRLEHGQLTDAGAKAVDMSYLTAVYADRQAPLRIGFALDNWSRLTPEGRKAVMREVAIARSTNVWKAVLATVRRGPSDPAGRVAAALLGMS